MSRSWCVSRWPRRNLTPGRSRSKKSRGGRTWRTRLLPHRSPPPHVCLGGNACARKRRDFRQPGDSAPYGKILTPDPWFVDTPRVASSTNEKGLHVGSPLKSPWLYVAVRQERTFTLRPFRFAQPKTAQSHLPTRFRYSAIAPLRSSYSSHETRQIFWRAARCSSAFDKLFIRR